MPAGQVRLVAERLDDEIEAPRDVSSTTALYASGVVGFHKGASPLYFRRDEIQPLHHAIALGRAERGRQRAGLAIGNVLQDDRDLGEALAVEPSAGT